MKTNIIRNKDNQIAVLSLVGDPLGEPDAILLRKKIYSIGEEMIRYVVIDLAAVKHINSAGLGGLIAAMFSMLRKGGKVNFASPGVNVQEVFRITKLDKVFTIHENVDKAIDSFQL